MMTLSFRKMVLSLAALACTSALFAAATPDNTVDANTEHWFIVGGNRGVAYALVSELNNQEIPCTVFVRDGAKGRRLFGDKAHVCVVEGEATGDQQDFMAAAQHASHIFMGQSFPYKTWEKSLQAAIDNCLETAAQTGAQFIYPGRIYPKGVQTPITEETPSCPLENCKQGQFLKEIEDLIEASALQNSFDARIIRHSYPYGPMLGDGMLDDNFKEIPRNTTRSWWSNSRKFEWIGSTEVTVQLSYTPDLARFIIEYAHHATDSNFEVINFAGHTFESMDQFGEAFCQLADEEYVPDAYSHAGLTLRALGFAEAERGKDIFYSFEQSILLDDAKMHATFPEFKMTEPSVAQYQTLKWYQEHYA